MVVERPGDADRASRRLAARRVVGVELRVERRLEAGVAQALLGLEGGARERFVVALFAGSRGRRASPARAASGGRRLRPQAAARGVVEQVPAGAVLAWMRVEHPAAAQRVRRRDLAHHQAVAGRGDQRLLEPDLPEAAAEPGQPGWRLAGAVVDLDPVTVLGLASLEVELGVDQVGRAQVRRRRRRARRRARPRRPPGPSG